MKIKMKVSALACPKQRSHEFESARIGARKNFVPLRDQISGVKRFSTFGGYPSPFTPPAGVPAGGSRHVPPTGSTPRGRFALRGCYPVSPLDPPDYGPPCGPRTEVCDPSSPPKGSLWGPTSHGNPLFSHYSAPHALRKMFSLVLDPPVFDSGRCPFHFFDLEKKNYNYAQVLTRTVLKRSSQ